VCRPNRKKSRRSRYSPGEHLIIRLPCKSRALQRVPTLVKPRSRRRSRPAKSPRNRPRARRLDGKTSRGNNNSQVGRCDRPRPRCIISFRAPTASLMSIPRPSRNSLYAYTGNSAGLAKKFTVDLSSGAHTYQRQSSDRRRVSTEKVQNLSEADSRLGARNDYFASADCA
jgi:hypothetical protein